MTNFLKTSNQKMMGQAANVQSYGCGNTSKMKDNP